MGILRSVGRSLAMPYVKSWEGVTRIGRALGSFPRAASNGSRAQTDELSGREDKPVSPEARFDWYCKQLELDEDDLRQRAVNFEMVRKTAIVAAAISLPGAVWMGVRGHWFFCATDVAVALTFCVVALRNAFFLHQVLNREVISLRTFFSRDSLFSEWFSWRRR